MKHRLDRVRELIKRELSELVSRNLTFPDALVTIHSVDVTPDLRQAHIFVSAIGSEKAIKGVMPALHAHRVELQQQLCKRVILKYTPQLNFRMDDAIERGDRVIGLLSELEIPEDTDHE